MLEITQDVVEKIEPLLDAGDTESVGKLLVEVDPISLRAVLIYILRERGGDVADAVGSAFLHRQEACLHEDEVA